VSVSSFQSLVQRFFTDRLLKQLGASSHTIAAYRDAFRLLLQFASECLRRAPSERKCCKAGRRIWPSADMLP
jgi:integrase/recombinase XerD